MCTFSACNHPQPSTFIDITIIFPCKVVFVAFVVSLLAPWSMAHADSSLLIIGSSVFGVIILTFVHLLLCFSSHGNPGWLLDRSAPLYVNYFVYKPAYQRGISPGDSLIPTNSTRGDVIGLWSTSVLPHMPPGKRPVNMLQPLPSTTYILWNPTDKIFCVRFHNQNINPFTHHYGLWIPYSPIFLLACFGRSLFKCLLAYKHIFTRFLKCPLFCSS